LEIMKRRDSYYAQDLGSTNGTTWNGERMIPYKSYPLANGDKLCIIRTQFVFKTE
jgi:pSer/pThr/pTyr-binding forkhead associated (FHA) protein